MSDSFVQRLECSDAFVKRRLFKGQPVSIRCVEIGGQVFATAGRALRTVSIEDEWYEDVRDPEAVMEALRTRDDVGADIFTFWQRPPHTKPRFPFHHEIEDVAMLPVSTYEDWLRKTINAKTRNMVRKAAKHGVSLSVTEYDDDFVHGMTRIFNESAVRQGRRFWHYGKDFETVKRQFSEFIHRETMIRADLDGEMIGFVMLGDAGEFALIQQIMSSLPHRDKAVNNALIAKSVELCAERGIRYLCYYHWGDDSLTAFKRSCGFECISLPRYCVPLTWKGALALRVGAHRGLASLLPAGVKQSLKRLRSAWLGAHAK